MAEPASRVAVVLKTPRPALRTPAPVRPGPAAPGLAPIGFGGRVKAGVDYVLAAGLFVAAVPVLLSLQRSNGRVARWREGWVTSARWPSGVVPASIVDGFASDQPRGCRVG